MNIYLDNFCVHFNGVVKLNNRTLLCRDFSMRVFNDSNRYCMRDWSDEKKIQNAFACSNTVTQCDLNQYVHHFSDYEHIGELLKILFNEGNKSFLIAFSRHLAVIKFFQAADPRQIFYQLYDPNHTNQAFECLSSVQDLHLNILRDVTFSGWGNYSNRQDSLCVMTKNISVFSKQVILQDFNWQMLGMLLRFGDVNAINERSKFLKDLSIPSQGIKDLFLTPRQILPYMETLPLIKYFDMISEISNSLTKPVLKCLLGVEEKPTSLDMMKLKFPTKYKLSLNKLIPNSKT